MKDKEIEFDEEEKEVAYYMMKLFSSLFGELLDRYYMKNRSDKNGKKES